MALTRVSEDLVDVQFYTALDPYYYLVDNRPLEDLDYNIRLIAESSDSAAGGADRAALGGASLGYSMLGFGGTTDPNPGSGNGPYYVDRGMYSGATTIVGLEIFFNHGFAVIKTDGGIIGGRPYELPALAVHDTITKLTLTPGAAGQTYLIQGQWRVSTLEDRVGSGTSPVQVLEIDVKSSPLGAPPLLDSGNIAIMRIDLPAGSTSINDGTVTYLNYKDIEQTSDVLTRAKIGYNTHGANLTQGTQTISLNGTSIDPNKIDSVEVFVEGVNQFNWTYNSTNNSVVLQAPLAEAAEILVRQTVISLT